VFAPLQRFLPPVVGDALLMTYRSLFLLLDKFAHVLTAARLRAGFTASSPVRSARSATRALSAVLLYSLDLSQRTYDVMYLRGYERRLAVRVQRSESGALTFAVLAGALATTAVAVLWRLGGAALAPYAWLPLLLGVAALATGGIARTLGTEGRS
jgi:energy-coupling factor transporter transmembrane protein EcfT